MSSTELTGECTIIFFILRGTGSNHRWNKATQESKGAVSEFAAFWDQLKRTGSAEQATQNVTGKYLGNLMMPP